MKFVIVFKDQREVIMEVAKIEELFTVLSGSSIWIFIIDIKKKHHIFTKDNISHIYEV